MNGIFYFALDCGGEFKKESGVLTSPGYPKLTDKRMICTWKITVPEGARIKFEFLDLDLHDHYRCSTGYVQLQDLSKSGFDSLGTFCGTRLPSPSVSLGNVISVAYYSNKKRKVRGFRAKWSTYKQTEVVESEFAYFPSILFSYTSYALKCF